MTYDNAKFLEVAKVIGDAVKGDFMARGRLKQIVDRGYVLNESISTSDLVRTFSAVNNAELERQYAGRSFIWTKFAKRGIFEDFRPKRKSELLFLEDVKLAQNGGRVTPVGSLPAVPEGTEYPTAINWTTSEKQLEIFKSGLRLGWTFESFINDDWGLIQAIPGQLMDYAARTEEMQAIQTFASATGPNTDTFKSGNGNVADNKKLNLVNLKAAKKAVRSRKINDNFVTVDKFVLVVTPAQRDDAEALLKVLSQETVEGIGSGTETRTTQQTSNGDVELVVSDYLTRVDLSANVTTTWYLLPAGGSDGTRDSIEVNFLRGHEKPQLTIAVSGHTYAGGGDVPYAEGNLRNDTTETRIRHIVAAGVWNAHAMYASIGTV